MHVHWKYMLAESPPVGAPHGTTPKLLGELTQARNKTLTLALNRSGNASFTIPMRDELAEEIRTFKTCLVVVRHETPVWSGPIVGISGALPDDRMTVNAVGWLDLLQNRELRVKKTYTPTTKPGGGEWKNHEVAFDVLSHVNTVEPGYHNVVGPGVVAAAPSGYSYANYQNTFEIGAKAEQIITSMAELENGYDWSIDPWFIRLNIKHWADRTKRESVHFGYGWGPENIARFDFTEDAMKTRNRLVTTGTGAGPGLAQVPTSWDEYGIHEETRSLPEITKLSHLQAYATAEVLLLNEPQFIFNITPFPSAHTNRDQVPRFMDDYYVGEQVYISVIYGKRLNIKKQLANVYSVSLSIDEEGNERVTGLTTSLSGGA